MARCEFSIPWASLYLGVNVKVSVYFMTYAQYLSAPASPSALGAQRGQAEKRGSYADFHGLSLASAPTGIALPPSCT